MALRMGIVGLGRHGLRYAAHLLEPSSPASLTAVCRRDSAQGSAFAAKHGLHFHRDYRELIADPTVDAVIVVTPPSLTRAVCLEAVEAGKPLLIEKPLATTGVDARDMVNAAEKAGVPLMTAQTLRFDEAVLALKAARGRVGAAQYLVLTNRVEPRPEVWTDGQDYAGRGVMLEIGIHLLDLVRFLTEEEVVDVRCEMDRLAPPSAGTPGPDIRALATLRVESGLACVIDLSRVTAGRVSRAEWIGEHGQLAADWVHHQMRCVTGRNRLEEWSVPDRPTVATTVHAFVDALASGAAMPITGRDGLRAVELADACYESAKTGMPVTIRPR